MAGELDRSCRTVDFMNWIEVNAILMEYLWFRDPVQHGRISQSKKWRA